METDGKSQFEWISNELFNFWQQNSKQVQAPFLQINVPDLLTTGLGIIKYKQHRDYWPPVLASLIPEKPINLISEILSITSPRKRKSSLAHLYWCCKIKNISKDSTHYSMCKSKLYWKLDFYIKQKTTNQLGNQRNTAFISSSIRHLYHPGW